MIRLLRIPILACAALAITTGTAKAASISILANGSKSFDIYWSLVVGSTQLSALGAFNVTVTNSYADFDVDLTNKTAASAGETVHSIGFNSDPNGTSITLKNPDNYFQNFGLDQKFPGFKTVDICVWASNNCSGGAEGSNLPGGKSDGFAFRLLGDFTQGLKLDNFVVKFQGDLGSFEFADTTPPRSVPEPSTLALLTIGAAAMMLSRRRILQ